MTGKKNGSFVGYVPEYYDYSVLDWIPILVKVLEDNSGTMYPDMMTESIMIQTSCFGYNQAKSISYQYRASMERFHKRTIPIRIRVVDVSYQISRVDREDSTSIIKLEEGEFSNV